MTMKRASRAIVEFAEGKQGHRFILKNEKDTKEKKTR